MHDCVCWRMYVESVSVLEAENPETLISSVRFQHGTHMNFHHVIILRHRAHIRDMRTCAEWLYFVSRKIPKNIFILIEIIFFSAPNITHNIKTALFPHIRAAYKHHRK